MIRNWKVHNFHFSHLKEYFNCYFTFFSWKRKKHQEFHPQCAHCSLWHRRCVLFIKVWQCSFVVWVGGVGVMSHWSEWSLWEVLLCSRLHFGSWYVQNVTKHLLNIISILMTLVVCQFKLKRISSSRSALTSVNKCREVQSWNSWQPKL